MRLPHLFAATLLAVAAAAAHAAPAAANAPLQLQSQPAAQEQRQQPLAIVQQGINDKSFEFFDDDLDDEPALIIPDRPAGDEDDDDEDDDGTDPDSTDSFPEVEPGKLRYSAFSFSDTTLDHAETALVAAQLHTAFGTTPSRKVPILLLHGFLGFDNLLGILNYFGGFTGNVARHLRKLGYRVLIPAVGPISSNWERACELYAQIRGTVVDYGLSHSLKYGHSRYGRSYVGRGLYPEWGSTPDAQLNIIAHSQGGPTARMLIHLLRYGLESEDIAVESARAIDPAHPDHGPVSPLLSSRTSTPWVRALITVSSPLKGTTVINVIDDWIPFIRTIVKGVYGLTGAVGPDGAFPYDFMLDHWGLTRQRGEKLDPYLARLRTSPFLKSESNGFFDNGVIGTRSSVNDFIRNDPSVFYFSVSNADTRSVLLSNKQVAKVSMNPILAVFGNLMGQYTNKKIGVDSSWHENDGIVNRIGMDATNTDKKAEYAFAALAAQPSRPWLCPICSKVPPPQVAAPKAGVWNHLGFMDDWDHLDVVGILSLKNKKRLYNMYENLAAIVAAVPNMQA